jgi:hypothetical protein
MTTVMLIVWAVSPRAVPAPLPLGVTVGIIARVFGAQPISPGILVLGSLVQFAYGAFWGGLLEITSVRPSVVKAIVLALGLWLIMVIFYMPMAGVDTFKVATSPGVWIATLIGHVLYGYTLGALLVHDQRAVPPIERIADADQ